MNRKRILSVAVFLGIATASIASAQAGCAVAGRYMAKGQLTGASNVYKGEVIIKDQDGGCFVRWLPPNTSSGVGTYADGVLTMNYVLGGKPGVVRYERSGDGVMEGSFWPQGHPTQIQGVETLTPID
ncbi:MAG: hypothetical protein WDN08_21340 [Rhizomicrobium sp.]